MEYKEALALDLSILYLFEVDFSKKSPIYNCKKYNHLYMMQKGSEIINESKRNPERRKNANKFIYYANIFFVSMMFIFLLSLCFSYRERNRLD